MIVNESKDFVVSIDWLQINLRAQANFIEQLSGVFDVNIQEYKTRHFNKVAILKLKGVEYATLQYQPLSKILPEDMVLCKFSNQIIYRYNWIGLVNQFVSFGKFKFISFSRLDLAIDFNTFLNNYEPQNFVLDLMQGNTVLKQHSKFKCIGTIGKEVVYDYFRIGTENSPISWYLYNKTKELQEVKDKPHIRELWEKANINTNKTVWRLEFSIKGTKNVFINQSTGEGLDMSKMEMISEENIKWIVDSLVSSKLVIYENTGKAIKSREKCIKLFNSITGDSCNISPNLKIESDKMDRYFIRKLNEVNNDYRSNKLQYKGNVDELLREYAKERDLVHFNRINK